MSRLDAHWSFTASTWAQASMLLAGLVALVPKADSRTPPLLHDVLVMEVIVQVVELVFYVYVLRSVATQTGALRARYADWFLTTPVMLISALALFSYRTYDSGIAEFAHVQQQTIQRMLLANLVMLGAGFMYTTGALKFWPSQIIGFTALALAFRELHTAVANPHDAALFWGTFALWAAYGVAVHYPVPQRNIIYNILDVFSKNVVGVYAAVLVLRTKHG